MATAIVMIKTGDTTVEEINSSYIRFKKFRLDGLTPQDHNLVQYFCYTNTGTEGLLDEIIGAEFESDLPANWNKIKLFDKTTSFMTENRVDHQNTKVVVWDTNLFPRDTCQGTILQMVNNAGDIEELPPLDYDIETLKTIRDKGLPFLEMPTKWWSKTDHDDTEYAHFYTGFNKGDLHSLYETFMNDKENVLETYGDTPQGLQKFIEDTFKGVVIPTGCGYFGVYYIGDRTANDRLNVEYKENVSCYFPQEWHSPNTEDMDGDYLTYHHEWRTLTPQVKMVYADTSVEPDTRADLYFRTWIHGE